MDRANRQVGESAGTAILSPHTLLSGLHVTGPSNPVTVEGTVESVRANPQYGNAYLTLSGGGGTIEARVRLDEAPSVREVVRVTGMVTVQPRTVVGTGLSVILFGRVEDAVPRPSRSHVQLHKTRRVPLEALLEENRSHSVVVLGTERAFSDLSSTGLREVPRFLRVSTVSASALLDAASKAEEAGASGIIFTRGGSDDGSETLWDDLAFVSRLLKLSVPFYTAIGHSDRLHLADLYADQAFTTPTHIGAEIRRITERQAAKVRSGAELARLRQRVSDLERASAPPLRRPHVLQFRWPTDRREWLVVTAAVVAFVFLLLRGLR